MSVSNSIQDFLYELQSSFREQYFWIDAVCINQRDNEEKKRQVKLMTRIYEKASRVIVWLSGPTTIEKTRNLQKFLRLICFNPYRGNSRFSTVKDLPLAYKALLELFCNEWFERVWILQEVAVGKSVHVMINGFTIMWESLSRVADEIGLDFTLRSSLYLQGHPKVDINDPRIGQEVSESENKEEDELMWWPKWGRARTIEDCRKHYKAIRGNQSAYHLKGLKLVDLLQYTLPFKATNPRDNVFALFGLTETEFRASGITIDYNLCVDKVFKDTTVYLLSQPSWFMTFCHAGCGHKTSRHNPKTSAKISRNDPDFEYWTKLPSWVIDFGSMKTGMRLPLEICKSTPEISFSPDYNRMILDVHPFDLVKHVYRGNQLPYRERPMFFPDLNDFDEDFTDFAQLRNFMHGTIGSMQKWYLIGRQFVIESKLGVIESGLQDETAIRHSRQKIIQEFWELCTIPSRGTDNFLEDSKLDFSSSTIRELYETDLDMLMDRIITAAKAGDDVAGTLQDFTNLEIVQVKLQRAINMQTVAVTGNGNLALVPPFTKEGDVFVHFKSGNLPVLLRPKTGMQRTAEVVGTCLVHKVDNAYPGPDWAQWTLV
jgi:Heterokaryon incompatibility protein (HET)